MKNINFKLLIPYLTIVVLLGVIYFIHQKNSKLSEDLQSETKLRLALVDTIGTYRNARNELVAEKRTLQFNLTDAEFKNKELVQRIKETEKKNATLEKKVSVFAAALMEQQVKIDELQKSIPTVSEKDSSVTFTSKTPDIVKYTLKVQPVLTFKDKVPELKFLDFSLPNKQFIEFHWRNNPKEGYPISFSVTNTNPYFKTTNIESYAIPEIKKPDIKPTFWQKLGRNIKNGGEKLIYVGIGVGAVLILK